MIRRLMLLAALTNGIAAAITHNPLFAIAAAFILLAAILQDPLTTATVQTAHPSHDDDRAAAHAFACAQQHLAELADLAEVIRTRPDDTRSTR